MCIAATKSFPLMLYTNINEGTHYQDMCQKRKQITPVNIITKKKILCQTQLTSGKNASVFIEYLNIKYLFNKDPFR